MCQSALPAARSDGVGRLSVSQFASISLSVSLLVRLSVFRLPVCLLVCESVSLLVCLSVCLARLLRGGVGGVGPFRDRFSASAE